MKIHGLSPSSASSASSPPSSQGNPIPKERSSSDRVPSPSVFFFSSLPSSSSSSSSSFSPSFSSLSSEAFTCTRFPCSFFSPLLKPFSPSFSRNSLVETLGFPLTSSLAVNPSGFSSQIDEDTLRLFRLQLLERRETRFQEITHFLSSFHLPVVSCTLNLPGFPKNFPLAQAVAQLLYLYLQGIFLSKGWQIKATRTLWNLSTGPEWQLVLSGTTALDIKTTCTAVEEKEKWGRVLDLDVFAASGQQLSRKRKRLCFLCDQPAAICRRERKHDLAELQHVAFQLLSEAHASLLSSLFTRFSLTLHPSFSSQEEVII